MNFEGLIILLLFLYVAPKFNIFLNKLLEKRMDHKNFTVRRSRVYAWYFTLGSLLMCILLPLLAIHNGERPAWEYWTMSIMLLGMTVAAIKMQRWKLRVKEGTFCFTPSFGQTKKFILKVISSLSYTTDKIEKKRYITLYSKRNVLVQVDSSKLGFGTLLMFLQKEGLLEENPKFNHDIPVRWILDEKSEGK